MTHISQREEFLFIYDITNANPNGDPLDGNKPRLDEESGHNIVTDVRLKRTIRDYLFNYLGHDGSNNQDIFVREMPAKDGKGLKDGKARVKDFGDDRAAILQRCVDIRLFGGVLPMDKDSITLTGPVQLKMGRSLHRVVLKHIRGTGAFASTAGKKQSTFRDEYILPYSLICFYGVVNENTARHTGLSSEDVELFYQAMWDGTKNLISRSKMGHMPRLLVRIRHAETNFFIGDLDKYIALNKPDDLQEESLRDIRQVKIDLTPLDQVLTTHGDRIDVAELRRDPLTEVVGWNR